MRISRMVALAAAAGTALAVAPAMSAASPASVRQPAPPPDSAFQKVTLNDSPGEPVDLAVLPDGRVLHTTRAGELWLHDPDTRLNTLAAELDVYTHDEEGLQSVAVDPGFNGTSNRWVYLYYAPPMDTPVDDPATPDVNEGDAPFTGTPADFEPFEGVQRLSRFQLKGNELDLSTEQQILEVEEDRGICCHVGGDIVFDGKGNLYLSTGDDTNPFESDGYTPIDERADRNPAFDAQRTSANTNDLRGKVLRIRVQQDGSYTIPDGNLFEPGTPQTRPEIYLMGLRNPFRIEVNGRGDLYVADYSPDAAEADPGRGPSGHGRWLVTREAGNYGWPYCVAPDMPYVDYDFATEQSGEPFDCAAPVNNSPHNTGLTELPPVEQPDVWYTYAESEEFPELGATGGIGPMAGPAYEYDPRDQHGRTPVAWPKYYDGMPLFYEWTRDYIKGFRLDRAGELTSIEDVVPSIPVSGPIDMEFGPDGALYVLDYGKGYFAENPDAQLARIDYIGTGGNHTPVPVVTADVDNGQTPLTVNFSSEGTQDADGDRLRYEWDFDSDGDIDSRQLNPTHTYTQNGVYTATLKVTDLGGKHRGRSASAEVDIVVGNEEPVVTFVSPVEGQPFEFGDVVQYEVAVTDDQPVDCSRVQVTYILGHDDHGHPISSATGCTGSFVTTVPDGHDPEHDELAGVFNATYTDPGAEGVPPLTGTAEVALTPTE
ncbi:glycosyl hydrolase [Prauserella sp. PE36]|uniref:PKD domain-containing protein n=1 Tax=Prauserella endophytica TaxID=1592324 RepID=A0ABY2S4J8_9PSEU|nr:MULTISPECIES: PQQ-dependent sugar dehydrogenase [Prauserella]PXY33202.1 glycosyl hydrolase [Prauserella coralliicola]RBM16246.1 glycosyl hydrolase [Prauserella sp. PE36]TKG70780.1 PKD domain-containing protein [Prauserella endophytica]